MNVRHLIAITILSAVIGLWGMNASAESGTPPECQGTRCASDCPLLCISIGCGGHRCEMDETRKVCDCWCPGCTILVPDP
jgi:hypothetical protein